MTDAITCHSCGTPESEKPVRWVLMFGADDVPLCDDCAPKPAPRAPLAMATSNPWAPQSRRDIEQDREVAREREAQHQREQG